jgi:hypothetical protein
MAKLVLEKKMDLLSDIRENERRVQCYYENVKVTVAFNDMHRKHASFNKFEFSRLCAKRLVSNIVCRIKLLPVFVLRQTTHEEGKVLSRSYN